MQNTKKMLTSIFSAMALTLASMSTSITAFATEIGSETTISEITTETTTDTALDIQLDSEDMQKIVEELQNGEYESTTDDSGYDYYGDDYYDTDGNATLIKHEDIIYDSEEMQFIAVTTKDGNVFYILINYSSENGEDNVFFLNKVDDFDLYSLLYASNESEEDADPIERAEEYANVAIGKSDSSIAEETTSVTETLEENPDTKQSSPMNSTMLIIVGVVVLAGIGGVIFALKSGKLGKKKNAKAEDFDDDFDDDYGDVNVEDEEE